MYYEGRKIPIPVLRIGNAEKVNEATIYIKKLYEYVQGIKVFDATLDKRKDERKERAKRLSEVLRDYDTILDLKDRKEAINSILEFHNKSGA